MPQQTDQYESCTQESTEPSNSEHSAEKLEPREEASPAAAQKAPGDLRERYICAFEVPVDELKGPRPKQTDPEQSAQKAPAETTEERNRRARPWQSQTSAKSVFDGSALVRTPKPQERDIQAIDEKASVKTDAKSLYYATDGETSPFGPVQARSPELTAYPPGPTLESGRPRFYPEDGERIPPPASIYPAGLSCDKPWKRVVWFIARAVEAFDFSLKAAEKQFLRQKCED